MKKISSFIPVHVINKTDLIKELSCYISDVFPKDILNMIEINTIKDDVLIISCKNSSIATKMRFEKQIYLDVLKDNPVCEIRDIAISLID
jgi:hypothetical protein